MINNNTALRGEFDLIGFSQGTILSRYIIENCKLVGKVRNFIAFGGPLNGQSVNLCSFYDVFCILKRWYDSSMVFTDKMQNSWAPAGYFKVPGYFQEYLEHSSFLAEANNEVNYSEARREKMLNLKRAMFIKWDNEKTIKPAESSWWGEYDDNYNVLHRNQTALYQKDLIGIKTLEEQGRAKFVSIPGGHMDYTWEEIDNIVIPFLLGG
mmetsp:Transcript_42912/g.50326  ORF Transcript_42912/g.50326 Transcript_42912/m.50326 type:complete len:209 (-) Transcript_42912:18-644(-)